MQTFSPIAVIRVLSDANKDEVACVALAAGTLYEEGSFYTVLNNQDIHNRRDIFERDLQIIYSLLNNRVWFAFDVESAAKTLERLYRSINQSPPQSLNHWEALQLFESTFSHSCNSLASAAQYLQIVPWNKRSVNARTECDVTCEILSRIALNCTVRQWGAPNQGVSSLSSDDQINDNSSRTKTAETQTQPHTHTHTYLPMQETTSYEAQLPMNTNEEEKALNANEQLGHKEHYHTRTNNTNDINTSNIDTNQPTSQEIDTNRDQNIDNKTSAEFVDNSAGVDLSHPTEAQSNFPPQSQKSDLGHFNRANEAKRESDTERDVLAEESNLNQAETRNAAEDSTKRDEYSKSARSGPTSWKDLAKGKGATTSPSRTSQLHVVPGIRNKAGPQGKFKPLQPTRDQQTIKQYISNAMATNRVIWISYDGGKQPLVPRGVTPTKWDDHPGGEMAFLGVPFRSRTGKESKFFLRQVKEVRDKVWSRPEDAKFTQNRNNTTKEEKVLTDSPADYNNTNADNAQSQLPKPQTKKSANKRTQ